MAIDLFEETMALLTELERHGVPYAVVGALALAIHGVPRATTDIDLLVRRDDVEATLRVAETRGLASRRRPCGSATVSRCAAAARSRPP